MACGLCKRSFKAEMVDAGGDLGVCHRACFNAWDDEDERITLDAMRWRYAPDELVALTSIPAVRSSPRTGVRPSEPNKRQVPRRTTG